MRRESLLLAAMVACSSSASGGSGAAGGDSRGGTLGGREGGGASSGGDDASAGAGSDDAIAPDPSSDDGPSVSADGPSVSADGSRASGDGAIPVMPSSGDGGLVTYGKAYTDGVYNLGPVDYAESQFHNACAPSDPAKYTSRVQAVEGNLLAGLWEGIPNTDSYCDACIWVVTNKGKSAMLRVVTYGSTTNDSIDTSPQAFSLLNLNENPRSMTWQFAKCPDTGAMMYEFEKDANPDWTALWVRNARVPIAKVEVESPKHASWFALSRGNGDGSLTDAGGFGTGSFTIRTTGVDGQQVTDKFAWPSGGLGLAFLTGHGNFQ